MADWLSLGATVVGGLLGSQAGGDTQQTATQTKDPWAPAQPYLLANLQKEAALQDYYAKNPFNQQQIEGYSNLFGDIGNFRDNVAPGLMNFANQGMSSAYQRQTGGAPGSGGGYGGAVVPGQVSATGQGSPFSVAQGAGAKSTGVNGLLDLNGAQNPYANGLLTAPAPAPAVTTPAPATTSGGLLGDTGGGNGGLSDSTPAGGIGVGAYTDAITQQAMDIAQKYALASPLAGVVAGLVSYGMSEADAVAAVNASPDPIGMLNALQGWTGVDPTYDLYGFGDSGGFGATSASSGNGSPGHNNAGSTSGSDRGEGGGSSSSSRSGL